MHQELQQVFLADQAARMPVLHPDRAARARARRQRLEQLISAGALQDHHDKLHAAFLVQHGGSLDSDGPHLASVSPAAIWHHE